MSRVEGIVRTEQLAQELSLIMKERGWGQRQLARAAGVSPSTVFSMLHPDYSSGVSKERSTWVIEAAARNPREEFRLLQESGIPVYRIRGSRRFIKLL